MASTAIARLKMSLLGLEHSVVSAGPVATAAIKGIVERNLAPYMKWWLRRFEPFLDQVLPQLGDADLSALLDADADFWRPHVAGLVPQLAGQRRVMVLQAVTRHANRQTLQLLRSMPGADIADARRNLINRQAPHLFIRAFGGLTIHRGAWRAKPVRVTKRRLRLLLGLLVANADATLTRDQVLDLLWPDADPASAVNSLNQSVFQLRHVLDPSYRDGDSPVYLASDVDSLQLNPELVRTDLHEFRRLTNRVGTAATAPERFEYAAEAVALIRGEYLADVRYEDWTATPQLSAQAEVRRFLLPIAAGEFAPEWSDLALEAAHALIALDPLDEAAHIALADQMNVRGQRGRAKLVLIQFSRRLAQELGEGPSQTLSAAVGRLSGQDALDPQRPELRNPLTSPRGPD